MSGRKYELRVVAGHRYAEVPVRTKAGKVYVTKERVTTLRAADLAEGEDEVITRYVREGKLTCVVVEPSDELAPLPEKAKEKAKAGR